MYLDTTNYIVILVSWHLYDSFMKMLLHHKRNILKIWLIWLIPLTKCFGYNFAKIFLCIPVVCKSKMLIVPTSMSIHGFTKKHNGQIVGNK